MVNLDKLLEKASRLLKKDITHIAEEAKGGKLPAASSRDLVNYIKVLSELNEWQKEARKGLGAKSDAELRKLAEKALKESSEA